MDIDIDIDTRSVSADYQRLAASLDRIAARTGPDPAVVHRLQHLAAAHPQEETP